MQTWTKLPADAAAVALAGLVAADAVADTLETPELLDVDVNDLAWALALILTFRLGRLQIAYPVNPKRRRMRLTVAGDTSTSAAICLPVWRCRRKASMAVHLAGGVWLGDEWGLEERSCIPSTPSARNRLAHFATVFGVVLNW